MRISQHPILDQKTGREVSFTFDGQPLVGREGEMVSSALFANGIRTFSRHKVDNAPQGIFCANGQCAQCTVLIDGLPMKSCITPLREGMDIRTLVHYPTLPPDDELRPSRRPPELSCQVLVVGAGPSGITAAIELADAGYSVILVDDKDHLGGKLVLQTHKFFGSMADCYAGTRGTDIAKILEEEARKRENITIMTDSVVVGVFADGKAGIYQPQEERYLLLSFAGVIVATGARERSLVFPGNDLPGVFGAGAFQTLVNRDLVKSSERVLIVGCGNVGLIAAYHALQAGIDVVALIDIAPKVSGYKVHGDKIKRMGVPIYLSHTLVSVQGEGKVEKATIAQVDESWNPLLSTAKTFAVDTVLIAVGLSSVDEFYSAGLEAGFPVLKTGDANEIAEASSAMIGGRITGREMARRLGSTIDIPEEWFAKAEILKSPPGEVFPRTHTWPPEDGWQPVIHCYEEIPCNPCTTVCPHNSIQLTGRTGTIMDLPEFSGKCIGCGLCVLICPGLAITLVRESEEAGLAEVVLPYEFDHNFQPGDQVILRDVEGSDLGRGTVLRTRFNKKHRTHLLTLQVQADIATKVAGILVQDPAVTQPLPEADFTYLPDNAIVCRCERITVGQIKEFVRENEVTDLNQLKLLRTAMGACGGKTCLDLLPRVLMEAGVKKEEIRPATYRPLTVEIPMKALANQGGDKA
ncbi:MAG: FAD-dependent oxidoreductase [Limnochordia bacterium]|jgi:sarcosine oxidase subunit alpha|nr:FAD-dependent oxidoreductase [Limnochordia bacterium]MDI9465542.1 FAD-dependent oxidoreductase [Bacillota bacterium]HOB40227.1 FAD-dependent oxidoreductase [Limnochordia bacterium]HOK32221.1 FAD-dependent oxidoreductase [Limnochordia bacterium]HOM00877.1 FAD-dependent oxidoreductase [Limnochordia bacterium]